MSVDPNARPDYPPSLTGHIITSPDWVFTDALTHIKANSDLTVVIHKTACGAFCSATSVANTFANDVTTHKSAHFIVGRDGSVIQVVLLKDGAGANCCLETGHDTYWDRLHTTYGNLNTCTISIEHEDWSSDNSQVMTPEQIQASIALCIWLRDRYHLSPVQYKGHNTLDPISRARCPGPTYPWQQLMTALGATTDWTGKQFDDVWASVTGTYVSGIAKVARKAYIQHLMAACHQTSGEIVTHDWNGTPILAQTFSNGYWAAWYNAGHCNIYNGKNELIYSGTV